MGRQGGWDEGRGASDGTRLPRRQHRLRAGAGCGGPGEPGLLSCISTGMKWKTVLDEDKSVAAPESLLHKSREVYSRRKIRVGGGRGRQGAHGTSMQQFSVERQEAGLWARGAPRARGLDIVARGTRWGVLDGSQGGAR